MSNLHFLQVKNGYAAMRIRNPSVFLFIHIMPVVSSMSNMSSISRVFWNCAHDDSRQITTIPRPEFKGMLEGNSLQNHHLGWPTGGLVTIICMDIFPNTQGMVYLPNIYLHSDIFSIQNVDKYRQKYHTLNVWDCIPFWKLMVGSSKMNISFRGPAHFQGRTLHVVEHSRY